MAYETPVVTDEMVEAGAEVFYDATTTNYTTAWIDISGGEDDYELDDTDRGTADEARRVTRDILEAAIAVAPVAPGLDERRRIGSEFRAWRMEHEHSLGDVADDCGTYPSVVSNYEWGHWDMVDPMVLPVLGHYVASMNGR